MGTGLRLLHKVTSHSNLKQKTSLVHHCLICEQTCEEVSYGSLQRALTARILVTQLNPCWKGTKLQVYKYDALSLSGSHKISSLSR